MCTSTQVGLTAGGSWQVAAGGWWRLVRLVPPVSWWARLDQSHYFLHVLHRLDTPYPPCYAGRRFEKKGVNQVKRPGSDVKGGAGIGYFCSKLSAFLTLWPF
jgi:hypothetical protein